MRRAGREIPGRHAVHCPGLRAERRGGRGSGPGSLDRVLRGIGRFERRSSFRTWLFRILVNRAISAGVRERRSVPVDDMGPVVDASCFDAGGTWQVPPEPWADQVDDQVIAAKISARILAAIDELPLQQREVVTLRDVQGLSSGEVCAVLDISNANQRVLLHSGRSKLRQVIGSEFGRGR
ncbi:MAG TPA: RNA polymerase sigma factor [Streptosporangiaceae bacterium]|nr:RNA polymerase sigma factor [Streptosporangiaceae bacterium]